MAKVRKVDFSPDEFLAGVVSEMTPVEMAVYWLICTLIYSRGEAIKDDHIWLASKFKKTDPRTVRAALEKLILDGKVVRSESDLMVNRCRSELEAAANRMRTACEHGVKSGRTRRRIKEYQQLTRTNPVFKNELSPSPSPSPGDLPVLEGNQQKVNGSENYDHRLRAFQKTGVWIPAWGPPPIQTHAKPAEQSPSANPEITAKDSENA